MRDFSVQHPRTNVQNQRMVNPGTADEASYARNVAEARMFTDPSAALQRFVRTQNA